MDLLSPVSVLLSTVRFWLGPSCWNLWNWTGNGKSKCHLETWCRSPKGMHFRKIMTKMINKIFYDSSRRSKSRALLKHVSDMLFRTWTMASGVIFLDLDNMTPATRTEDLEIVLTHGSWSLLAHRLVHWWCFLVLQTTWKGASSLDASN